MVEWFFNLNTFILISECYKTPFSRIKWFYCDLSVLVIIFNQIYMAMFLLSCRAYEFRMDSHATANIELNEIVVGRPQQTSLFHNNVHI